jgi:hypothetical protein
MYNVERRSNTLTLALQVSNDQSTGIQIVPREQGKWQV